MKKLLSVILLLISTMAFSQFTLEHTYVEIPATRIQLGINGEKYYQFDASARKILFFNADHSFWKEFFLPAPDEISNLRFWIVSDDLVNDDEQLEVAYSYTYLGNDGAASVGKIVNETGVELLSVDNLSYFQFLPIEGLSNKILAVLVNSVTKIYAANLVLEHTYPNTTLVKRIKLENSGEKYYYRLSDQIRFYNADHSLWKTILLSHSEGSYVMNVSLISEQINGSNLLKVGYNTQTQMPDFSLIFEGRIVDETGQILLTVPDATAFRVDTNLGLPPKLMVTTEFYQTQPFPSDFNSMKVYSLPNLELEHNYFPDKVTRANFELAGEKYFSHTIGANHTDIYNSDHSLWKTINFEDANAMPANGNLVEISQNTLNDDAGIEISYNYYTNEGFNSRIVNEFGDELLSIPACIGVQLSRITGLEDKLIARMYNGVENLYTGTLVYNLNSPLQNVKFDGNDFLIYPNPATDHINIKSSIPIENCKLYNAFGVSIGEFDALQQHQIDVRNYASGVYFLQIFGGVQSETHKMIIAH